MDTKDFPDEILLDIAHYVGSRSSHQLRNIALVSRRWYLVAAPRLLATIRVTSLGDLVKLCDHLAAAHVVQNFLLGYPISNSHDYVSMIEHHTRGIVIQGDLWPREMWIVGDYYTGLDKYQPPGGNSLISAPDIQITYQDMVSKLGAAIPHMKQLDSLEWYGRFPGDYYLVNYLLQTRSLGRLLLCIDDNRVRIPQSYCNIGLAFKRLKEFSLETASGEHSHGLVVPVINMLHRSPGLERIVLYTTQQALFSKSIYISHSNSTAPFVWPNLRYLEIKHIEGFWDKLENVDLFAQFLNAHRQLQTLIIGHCSHSYDDKLCSFSLAPYCDPLPNLSRLHAPLPIIAGILESTKTCSALITVIDTGSCRASSSTQESILDTVLQHLERAPSCRLSKLCISVARIQYETFRRLAKVAPGMQVLELRILESENRSDNTEESNTPEELLGHITETIVSGLNLFTRLHTIGGDITHEYRRRYTSEGKSLPFVQCMLPLANEVPRLQFIHVGNGALLTIQRSSDGPVQIKGFECTDSLDKDWFGLYGPWKTQPMSQAQEDERRKEGYLQCFSYLFR